MKRVFKYFTIIAALFTGALATSCVTADPLVESLEYMRCLTPLNLSVKIIDGDQVTFRWDAVKGADQYKLEVYSDKLLTNLVEEALLDSDDLPVTIKLVADSEYWFRVMAIDSSEKLEASKWAVYEKSVQTYAVKPTVYPAVAERTVNSLTISWDAEAAASEVDSIKWKVLGSDEVNSRLLTAEEVQAAKATVTGLEAFTNYVVSVYFKSANRGDLSLWTRSNTDGYTAITTAAALKQAAIDGGKYTLKMDGSPYVIQSTDLSAGIEIIGEENVDGKQPVIEGEFHILNTVANGADFIFKSVELNGAKDTYGFPIQLKNGAPGTTQVFDKIHFIGCKITGYSKGLIYEWGGVFGASELIWDGCTIAEVNKPTTTGGDGIDFRGKSDIKKLYVTNNTIYNGFRTFLRIDATTILGEVKVNNNTFMNLSKDDTSTNNNGIFGFKAKPTSLEVKNNLFLYMEGKAALIGVNSDVISVADLGAVVSKNYYYGITAENFFNTRVSQAEALAGGGKILEVDPCYKAKAGIFNISDTDIINAQVGAPKWLMAYNKKPEDLTMTVIEGTHNFDFTNPQNFLGTIDEKMVRDQLFMGVVDNKLNVSDAGIMQFLVPTTVNRAKLPLDGYLAFLVDKPGSVYVKPVNVNDVVGNHVVVGMGDAEGKSITIKGGAAANTDNEAAQKIVIRDITGPSLIYVYASGQIGLEKLGWSYDTTPVNTALPSPEPSADPVKFNQGEAVEAVVTWDPVDNAGSYSVVFGGKTYPVNEGTEYTVSADIIKFLDAGSYKVEVYANPEEGDVYNTQSAAGVCVITVAAKAAAGESSELIVASAQEFADAYASGKSDITLAYSTTPYELGSVVVTSPLRLKGQLSDDGKSYTQISANFTLSGSNVQSLILKNLDVLGSADKAVIIDDKAAEADENGYQVVADTVAILDSYIHDGKARLYDNSGKATSCVQNVIFKGLVVKNYSTTNDMIDFRAGHYHKVVMANNTFDNCARTFFRTDKGTEINYVTIVNNTFHKVSSVDQTKDNNGIFHIRSAAGTGMIDYRIMNNLFYSILIEETPANANGYPKFISKSGEALKPNVIANNYFYNIEQREAKADYSWWTVNCSPAEGLAGGGAVLPADPCKDAATGDFTLVNAVAMNSNIGDPRWNPMRGTTPKSQITVETVEDLLTAISAAKSTITLKAGTYDLTALTDVAEVSSGKLTIVSPLNLVGEAGALIKGSFVLSGEAVTNFTLNSLEIEGIGDYLVTVAKAATVGSVSIKNTKVTATGGLVYGEKNGGSYLNTLELSGCIFDQIGTKDFIDFRDGTTLNAVRVVNNTFSNGFRTFARIDATCVCSSINVRNNTFYNMCYVDNKDNNGVFHVRATTLAPSAYTVTKNLFASMKKVDEAPTDSNGNGYPKLVSKNGASIIPTFSANYYYDVVRDGEYSWWTTGRITEAEATAGYGVVLAETPFANATTGDFTLTSPLLMSEKIGDQRWNPNKNARPDDWFTVNNVDELFLAMGAGKQNVELAYGIYDFVNAPAEYGISSGKLTLATTLNLKGKMKDGKKPLIIGSFVLSGETVANFSLNSLEIEGSADNYLVTVDKAATVGKVLIKNTKVTKSGGLVYGEKNGGSNLNTLELSGNIFDQIGTKDFIDFRDGTTLNIVQVVNNTFSNGFRTFARIDASCVCSSIYVRNNTFYNMCYVDNKDNNGLFHVRASTLSPSSYIVSKNIFASMHKLTDAPTDSNKNGFPKLISTNSASKIPTFIGNIYYDVEKDNPQDDVNTDWFTSGSHADMTVETIKAAATANGGAILEETPFSGDPATTGKFNLKVDYDGIGDSRW